MENRYQRNRLYLNSIEQDIIKDCPIILGGCGIGSLIAECALRLGFENITIIDGDKVELSNLNRQNFTEEDLFSTKVNSIHKRLKSINKNANIRIENCFLDESNISELISGHKIAVNALDFSSSIPLVFDEVCQEKGIAVIHPYNLGFGGLVTVVTPSGIPLSSLANSRKSFNEVTMVEYMSGYLRFWGQPQDWIDEIIKKYKEEKEELPPPQLSIGSWFVAAMCTHILYNIATNKVVKKFPEFYLSTIFNS